MIDNWASTNISHVSLWEEEIMVAPSGGNIVDVDYLKLLNYYW